MDYADKKYDKQLIADTKQAMRMLILYTPLPFFWALFNQQSSRWTFQAVRMDCDIGWYQINTTMVVSPFFDSVHSSLTICS